MSDQVYKIIHGEQIPVEPVGTLATDGWLPGTWVEYSATVLTFSGAVAAVDLSDGEGVLAGFLLTGPQHLRPVELLSDMWTTDTRQRAGGDTKQDWGGIDAWAGAIELDEQFQLQRLGTRVVTMVVPPTGAYKFYVYETDNLAERTTPGSGASLTYSPGDKLYVSSRGRLTSEQEQGTHPWTGFVVARAVAETDDESAFLFAVAAMA